MSQPRRALISVSDKTGLTDFAKALAELGFQLISTGGTARYLRAAGLQVTDVTALTGFPEIMDGRVKTLHPVVHGGLLGRRTIDDDILERHDIGWIDLLVVNLYPFEATVAGGDCPDAEAIEQIDVGGPAMIRAAAKNHARVTVIVHPDDYGPLLETLQREDDTTVDQRRELAHKAFAHTARYDQAICSYLEGQSAQEGSFPETLQLSWARKQILRYGENPHQRAAFYQEPRPPNGTIASALQHQGKPLSFNNIADADAALECVKAFQDPACVIVKHANPCGVAVGRDPLDAYGKAFRTDPTSAFGGIIAINRSLDGDLAEEILARQFVEVIVAPAISDRAAKKLSAKKNVRVLAVGDLAEPQPARDLRSVAGGLLVQDQDLAVAEPDTFTAVTARRPTDDEWRDLLFAWTVVRFVKSNAVVFCRDQATVGVGAGQMSRVISTKIAALKAQEEGLEVAGSVLASDAFFPFRDGLDHAAGFGVSAIIQPGGSIRDDEVIAAANEHSVAMVFTGERHFRH